MTILSLSHLPNIYTALWYLLVKKKKKKKKKTQHRPLLAKLYFFSL